MPAYEARLDTYTLLMQTIDDSFDNAVAEYDYPFRDGAALDYLGEKARRIQFDCFFMRERYETHYAFLAHIRKGLLYELSHPKYGTIRGRISSPRVRHDERQRFCAITITFIEQLLGDEIEAEDNVVNLVESAYRDGQQEAQDGFAGELGAEWEYGAAEALAVEIDPGASLFSQFANLSQAVWSGMADLDRMLNVIDNYSAQIMIPADAVIGAVDFGLRLPGRVVGAAAACVERIAQAQRGVTGFPSSFMANFNASLTGLKAALNSVSTDAGMGGIVSRAVHVSAAQSCAVHVAQYYDADEQLRDAWERSISVDAFDDDGHRIMSVPDMDIYNVNELENSLYLARKMLQEAIAYNRERLHSCKRMAAALERHVRAIKLQRDRIVTVDVGEVITPVHTICRDNGLPHRYLEKIMAINNIENPTFAAGEVLIYDRP